MTTVGELINELRNYPPDITVTLVIDDSDGGQTVCSGDFSVDPAELHTNREVMLVGDADE